MAKIVGDLLRLHIDGNPGGVFTPIILDCEVDSTLSIAQNTVDTECKDGTDWITHLITKKQATISASGMVNEGTAGVLRLITNILAGTETLFEYKTYDTYKYTGVATIESFELSSAVSSPVTFSVSLKVNGALTQSVA